MFLSEVRSVYSHNMRDQDWYSDIYFLHFYTDVYFLLLLNIQQ